MIHPPISVLEVYGLHTKVTAIDTISNGLINHTWKLSGQQDAWVLQRINTEVFQSPVFIQQNIEQLSAYIQTVNPEYLFTIPLATSSGQTMVQYQNDSYRLFKYIPNTRTITVVKTAQQAEEAAFQFGNFTKQFADFDCTKLHLTIKQFHDLSLRYEQFLQSLKSGLDHRIEQTQDLISFLQTNRSIVHLFNEMTHDPEFKMRVTHHDTKISNVLFDQNDQGVCVIDLDTVMPGYFFSDLGDMFRTYLSPVGEDEQELSLIHVRKEIYQAIIKGYTKGIGDILSEKERQSLYHAGAIMIYMQALRFMTDYLNGDVYYQIQYADHNLVRARNQITLLKYYLDQRSELQKFQPE